MFNGIICALGACLIWGMIFVIPQYMEGFSSLEIATGRYLAYGIASCLLFLNAKRMKTSGYPLSIWTKALGYSLISSFGYYIFVVLSLRYASPAICALILGISPITIAFYGNWKQRECSNRSLILPSVLILAGLILINYFPIVESPSVSTHLIGLLCGFACLGTWTWYVVANARFLKQNPEVDSNDWATLLGVGTFFWALVFAAGLCLFNPEGMGKFTHLGDPLLRFVIGCTVLGLLCSWVGTYLWNRGSFQLPVSLMGQLNIFETIFGLVFVYILDQRLPPALECVGILLLLSAVIYGIHSFTKSSSVQTQQQGQLDNA
ncbi:MAG: DMT family transporter [Verrucomicrobia bacterium]|nr:DMT family transporter [Verrucomicrobiota bacterium]